MTTAVTESTASVSWDRVQAEIDGYILQYVSALGSSKEISVGADTTAYTLTGLRPGVVYTIYVWAFKGSRASRKSSTEAETGKLFAAWRTVVFFLLLLDCTLLLFPFSLKSPLGCISPSL